MSNLFSMKEVHSRQDLLQNDRGCVFIETSILDQLGEKTTSRKILLDEIEFLLIFEDVDHSADGWVV